MGIPTDIRSQVLLLPSVLSADFARLGAEVDRMLDAGMRVIHFDVMDGHFVPNLTIGPAVVAALAPRIHERGGWVDVHLMIENPDAFIEDFVQAGADALSVHVEILPHLHRTLTAIRELGASPGVVLNPATPASAVSEAIKYADYVLAMTVNPGFGGQKFISGALDKLAGLARVLPPGVALEVDGGVGRDTIHPLRQAGANWFVSGSAVFGAADPGREAAELQALALGGIAV
ncbi:MAG TPA: ribulose-phosphate 3-epimerase [Thermoleophilia bacterium]|nr:ribulose-phosphate 3-epimerase [Thermoleophilia bacterium]